MRALLHLGLFVLALTFVGQASADHEDGDHRRRERRTTVVIAPKVEHRVVRPVRTPVESAPPRYDYGYDHEYAWKKGRHHRHRAMDEARRDLLEQERDHEEIVRIADRWRRATYEGNPHLQRNAERRAHAWIEREISESRHERDHGLYVHRLHSLRRELRFSQGWHGYGRGRHRLNAHKARVFDELVELSNRQVRRARARVRDQGHRAYAYR